MSSALLFIIGFMVWIVTPLSCIWALTSLRKHPTWAQAIFKLVLVFLMMGEEASSISVRFTNALLTSIAALTAMFGLIDLVALKLDAMQSRSRHTGESNVDSDNP